MKWLMVAVLALALTDVELIQTDEGLLPVLTSSDPNADYGLVEIFYKTTARLELPANLISEPIELSLHKEVLINAIHGTAVAGDPIKIDKDKIYRVRLRYLKIRSVHTEEFR